MIHLGLILYIMNQKKYIMLGNQYECYLESINILRDMEMEIFMLIINFGGRVIHFLRFSIRGIFHVFGDWNHDFLASGDRSQHSQYSDASNHEIQTIPRFWA